MTQRSADLPFRNEGGGHVDQSKNAEPAAIANLCGRHAAPVSEAKELKGET